MADDMGFGDIRMAGNPNIHTPNLDQLSGESVNFTNFYVSPVCAPTRASLLTGKYAQRVGVLSVTNGYETLNPEATTIAEMMAAAGYRTGLFGKWHLGENYPSLPNAQGFQEFVGFRTGHFDNYFDPVLERNGEPYPTKGYITDVLTDEAITFMKESKNGEPFFCYLPFNAPHTPLDVPGKYLVRHQNKGLGERVERVYAMMENLDENVGFLLNFLHESGLEKNTIVIFLSDNGPIDKFRGGPEDWRFNAGLRDQKFTVYEGGIRTRFFARWPGHFVPNRTVGIIAAHIDVMPTLLDLCEIQPTSSVDGVSLKPLLTEAKPEWFERTLFQNYSLQNLAGPAPYPGGIARTQRYKMVNGNELYDLEKDPGEKENLAAGQPHLLAQLDQQYRAWWSTLFPGGSFSIRPISIGHDESKKVRITPHLGRAQGRLEYTGFRGLYGKEKVGVHPSGVDGDWLAHWLSVNESVTWEIEVVETGDYEVSIDIRCPHGNEGSLVRVSIGEKYLESKVPVADLKVGEWKEVNWGSLRLVPGKYRLRVQATEVAGEEVMELGSVVIRKQ
ncbi:arylsulfatase [Persicitalea jodogahamensis]|uniref:Arylsulfatase n=2 Tax=Persicitalea jodogahamensis TaxID=402147 RepID=A0A8J3CZZ8_9BACT|nr:arylsulfatase [Persicitalea jodogahamensis]